MKETIKILRKYLLIIIILIAIIGFTGNKDNILNTLLFIMKILSPLIGGAFIAYLLNPFIIKLENAIKKKSNKLARPLAIILAYIITAIVVIVLFVFFVPQLITSVKEILIKAPDMYDNIIAILTEYGIIQYLPQISDFDDTVMMITTKITEAMPELVSVISSTLKNVFDIFVSLVLSIYLTIDKEKIKNNAIRFMNAYLNDNQNKKAREIFTICDKTLHEYIIGKIIDSTIIGIICFIVMLVLKIDYPILISVLVGVTNMIPYFGPCIGGAFGFIILIITSPKEALLFALVILILQQIDGKLIGPKILGEKIGISPLWILFSVITGGALGGVIGMFLGPPIFAIITNIINNDINEKLEKKHEENNDEKTEE